MIYDDLIYLLKRAAEERIMVAKATNERARIAHLGMADAYDARLRGKAEAPASNVPRYADRALEA